VKKIIAENLRIPKKIGKIPCWVEDLALRCYPKIAMFNEISIHILTACFAKLNGKSNTQIHMEFQRAQNSQ
jgi:hypothetical protein